jgi:hypothetical protein
VAQALPNGKYRIQETEYRMEKAGIRESGYQVGGYQNIRKSDLKTVLIGVNPYPVEYILKKQSQLANFRPEILNSNI